MKVSALELRAFFLPHSSEQIYQKPRNAAFISFPTTLNEVRGLTV